MRLSCAFFSTCAFVGRQSNCEHKSIRNYAFSTWALVSRQSNCEQNSIRNYAFFHLGPSKWAIQLRA